MNALELKALARRLNSAAWAAGKDDDGSERRAKISIDAAFPTLPAGQTITLGAPADIDYPMLDLFGEPMSPDEATQRPMSPEECVADMIADARAHDEARGLLPNGCGEQTR